MEDPGLPRLGVAILLEKAADEEEIAGQGDARAKQAVCGGLAGGGARDEPPLVSGALEEVGDPRALASRVVARGADEKAVPVEGDRVAEPRRDAWGGRAKGGFESPLVAVAPEETDAPGTLGGAVVSRRPDGEEVALDRDTEAEPVAGLRIVGDEFRVEDPVAAAAAVEVGSARLLASIVVAVGPDHQHVVGDSYGMAKPIGGRGVGGQELGQLRPRLVP